MHRSVFRAGPNSPAKIFAAGDFAIPLTTFLHHRSCTARMQQERFWCADFFHLQWRWVAGAPPTHRARLAAQAPPARPRERRAARGPQVAAPERATPAWVDPPRSVQGRATRARDVPWGYYATMGLPGTLSNTRVSRFRLAQDGISGQVGGKNRPDRVSDKRNRPRPSWKHGP